MIHLKTFPPKGKPFKLVAVLKAEAPAGTDGSDWHRYEITQGDNTIVGYRQGSRRNVKLAIEEMVVHLNERRVGNLGRTFLMAPGTPQTRFRRQNCAPVRNPRA
jgi:hypothetical protein